jgi:tryptophanyl-tRNA synthetase
MIEPSFENPCLGRLIAGASPTGSIHIGELVGEVEAWVRLQDHYECIFIITDAKKQSRTKDHEFSDKKNIYEMLADWLAAGISPNNSIIALESAIPERLILVEMLEKHTDRSMWPTDGSGSLLIEAIEAAEMLLFKADIVSITEDQPKSSLKTAQNVGVNFNQKFGNIFPVLNPQILPSEPLPGLDGRPMQRRNDNLILLKDFDEETELKIGAADINTLFIYAMRFDHDLNRANAVIRSFNAGTMNEKELRKHVAERLNEYLHSARVKRDKWIAGPEDLESILQFGARRARAIATETIAEVNRIISRA